MVARSPRKTPIIGYLLHALSQRFASTRRKRLEAGNPSRSGFEWFVQRRVCTALTGQAGVWPFCAVEQRWNRASPWYFSASCGDHFVWVKPEGLCYTSPGHTPWVSIMNCESPVGAIYNHIGAQQTMPQSLDCVIIHLVFSTKDRAPLITEAIEPELHAYLASLCRSHGCNAYRVGGVQDHVHIVASLGRTITISQLVEKLKKASSKWMKTNGSTFSNFYWQSGSGVFSVRSFA